MSLEFEQKQGRGCSPINEEKAERLPPINKSTIRYQFNAEGQEICNHHAFCSHQYEFNDQSNILKGLSQPMSNFSGVQLPPPREIENENAPSRGGVTNQGGQRQGSKGGKRNSQEVDNANRKGLHNKPVNRTGITEEALDDWIAQSQNRPIISFLDPYKKFNVPDKLLTDFKVRYRKWLKTKEKDYEKKLLYFEDRSNISSIPHHQLPIRRPREAEKSITFRYKELQPQNINGTSIAVRENNNWKNMPSRMESRNQNDTNDFYEANHHDDAAAARDTVDFLRNISNEKKNQNQITQQSSNRDHLQLNHAKSRGNNKSFHLVSNHQINDANNNTLNIVNKNNNTQNKMNRNERTNSASNNKSLNKTQNNSGKKVANIFNSCVDISYNQNMNCNINSIEQNINNIGSLKNNQSANQIKGNINLIASMNQRAEGSGGGIPNAYLKISHIKKIEENNKLLNNSGLGGDNVRSLFHGLIPRIEMLLKDDEEKGIKFKGGVCLTQNSPRHLEKGVNNQLNKSVNISVQQSLVNIQNQSGQVNNIARQNSVVKINVIDISQRKSFDRHVDCLIDVTKIEKNLMTEVEFSFWKAVRRIQKQSYMQAIQCLKETLIFDKLHSRAIFNLGCLYEYLGMYDASKKWFDVALKLNESPNLAKYGLAICNYKLGNYESCFENIDQVIRCTTEPKQEHLYLRAVCNKKLENLDSAAHDYKQFIEYTCPSNFNMLMHLMFSMIFKNKRDLNVKVEPLVFCEFNSLCSQIIVSSEYVPALQPFWEDNQWVDIHFLIKRLKLLSFFNRFDENDIKKVLPTMRFNIVPKKKIIFPKTNEVLVIVAGNILVQDHINNLEQPDIISYFGEGDIIGFEEKDNNLSKIPDIWFASQTEVETLSFPKTVFVDLWKKHSFNLIKMGIFNFIQSILVFQGVSELTLYRLAFEIITLQSFNRDDIIFNDGECAEQIKYIELKKTETKTNKIAERMNSKMAKLDFTKRKINGFYMIKEGICELETPTGWLDYKLTEGDYFGENIIFNSLNINRFGRIKAKSEKVECYFLPRIFFEKIPLLDKNIMQSNCHKSPRFKECQRLLVQAYKSQN